MSIFDPIGGPLYAIALAIAGVLLIWSMRSPMRALLGWIITVSVQVPIDNDFLSGTLRPALADVFLVAMVLTFLYPGDETTDRPVASHMGQWILAFGALFLTLGNAVTLVELGTIPRWTLLNKDVGLVMLATGYFLAVRLLNTRKRIESAVEALIVSGFVINTVAMAGLCARYLFDMGNAMMRDFTGYRLVGFSINPSTYAGYLSAVFVFQFAVLMKESDIVRLPRWVQWLNALLLGAGIYASFSRSAYIGCVLAVAALAYLVGVKGTVRLIFIAVLLLAGFATLFSWYSGQSSADVAGLATYAVTMEQRMDINDFAMQMFFQSPIHVVTGIGIGTFIVRSGQQFATELQIHNSFLWILVELGAVGFLLLCGILFNAIRHAIEVARDIHDRLSPVGLGVACSLIATCGWFVGTEGLWHRHVWLLLALSEATYRAMFLPASDTDTGLIARAPQPRPVLARVGGRLS